ncbi:MAG: hypothetical protein H6Q73_1234 [Firmicutes bacterium]|nr:hypothetical protein [Bacillota bacterium]
MKKIANKALVRAALLLTLTLLFQWLRFLIPLPTLSNFITGTLVNACLAIAVEMVGLYLAAIIGVIAPIVAYSQGILPLPIFILPIAIANFIYVAVLKIGVTWRRSLFAIVAAVLKALVLYLMFAWLLVLLKVETKMATALLFAMGWPQLVTAFLGVTLATLVMKRIARWEK